MDLNTAGSAQSLTQSASLSSEHWDLEKLTSLVLCHAGTKFGLGVHLDGISVTNVAART